MEKALVLLSGGLDSATALAVAVHKFGRDNVAAAGVLYGQRHAKEQEYSEKIAEYYQVPFVQLDLQELYKQSNCPLLAHSTESVPDQSYAEQIEKNGEGMVTTYVPFRNGTFLSAATVMALSLFPDDEIDIYYGAHADDAAGNAYADCSSSFVEAMNQAINIGSYGKVRIVAPFKDFSKAGVVSRGLELKVPYELTWSCYKGEDEPCGICGTCIDRAAAFSHNDVSDPYLERNKGE